MSRIAVSNCPPNTLGNYLKLHESRDSQVFWTPVDATLGSGFNHRPQKCDVAQSKKRCSYLDFRINQISLREK